MHSMLKSIFQTPKSPVQSGDYTVVLAGGCLVDYKLTPANRKSMAISISGTGDIVVKCPHATPLVQIENFLREKSGWILAKQRAMGKIPDHQKPVQFNHGSQHQILGKVYTLHHTQGIRTHATLCDTTPAIMLEVAPNATDTAIKKAVIALYQTTAERIFPERLGQCYAQFPEYGTALPPLTIKPYRGRWGSMSHDGKMTLNTWLIRADVACIDYVIIHELCHMTHMNHGKGFYALQTQKCPHWQDLKQTLDTIQIA